MTNPVQMSERINKGDVIAVGDIHGSWDLFSQFVAWVKDSEASVILLGDLIDRGGDDLAVLDISNNLRQDPESWGLHSFSILQGNHERMFINAVRGTSKDAGLWIRNGGNVADFEEMATEHLSWIEELPIFMVVGDTLFTHAGVFPGEDPQDSILNGAAEEMVWIRNPFLSKGPQLHKWSSTIKKVVHGHTIALYETGQDGMSPVVKPDRVNIDTGAFLDGGFLTAYNVTQNTFNFFYRDIP